MRQLWHLQLPDLGFRVYPVCESRYAYAYVRYWSEDRAFYQLAANSAISLCNVSTSVWPCVRYQLPWLQPKDLNAAHLSAGRSVAVETMVPHLLASALQTDVSEPGLQGSEGSGFRAVEHTKP